MKNLLFLIFIVLLLIYGLLSFFQKDHSAKELTFTAVIGECDDCYNINGMERKGEVRPPSLDPNDWEIITDTHEPVVHHSATIGQRKIDPVGFYMTENNLALFYNSGWEKYFDVEREYRSGEATNQAGSLIAFSDNWEFEDYWPNPVLSEPQENWQGRNRVNPYALVYHPHYEVFYVFYGDFAPGGDCDKYPGRRALGLAKSKDLIEWEYLSVDKPFMHIEQAYEIIPEAFPNSEFCNSGRLYAFGAVWANDQIYLMIGGSIAGQNYSAIIRSREPEEYWKPVTGEHFRPMPLNVDDKWYRVQSTAAPDDSGKRALAIAVSENVRESGENHHIVSTGHSGSAGVSRQLFKYNGKWHIAYRQRDESRWAEGEDYRDLYIAREK